MESAGTFADPVGLTSPTPSRRDRRRRFWFVVWIAGVSTFRRRYAGTILGYAWTILQPVLLFAVLYLVFTRVIRFGGTIPHYEVMLLMNIVFIFFFRRACSSAMRSFVSRKAIVANVRVPPLAMPFAAILAALFIFATSLLVAFVWALFSGVTPQIGWLLTPVLVFYMLVIVTSIGVLLACTYVRVRDVAQVWLPLARLNFYVSGAIFPFAMIPDGIFRTLASINPLCPLFVQLRVWIIQPSAPNWPESAGSTLATILPFVTLTIICILATVFYRAGRTGIAENL